MTGALVYWSYCAGLTSFLTVEKYEYPIKSMEASSHLLLVYVYWFFLGIGSYQKEAGVGPFFKDKNHEPRFTHP